MDNKEQQPSPSASTRREFIKKTTTVAAAVAATNLFKTPVYGGNQAPSDGSKVIGANDRISVAVVGVGWGIGQNHLLNIHKNAAKNNIVVSAACDLFNKRRDWAQKTAELKDADVYSDHRKLLERKDVDAVLVATHDVWHAPISIDAMEAGKHVYCEKPMTRYLDEAFRVYDVAKRTKRVYQVGAQACSTEAWHKSAELISSGKIGQLVWSQGFYCRNSVGGEWNYKIDEITPGSAIDGATNEKNIDWERWQGQVHNKIAFNADHFHRWRKYYPYCAGPFGDLAPHRLHPLVLASGNPEFPVRVVSLGTKSIHADKNTSDTVERDVPEHQQLLAEFPSGYMITLTCSTVNAKAPGFVLYGHKATLNIGEGGNRLEIVPEAPFSEEVDPQTINVPPEDLDIRMHEKNWFDCIRTGAATNANIELAIRVQTVLTLAEMSNRLGIMCHFDEKTRTITDGGGKEVKAITYGTLPLS